MIGTMLHLILGTIDGLAGFIAGVSQFIKDNNKFKKELQPSNKYNERTKQVQQEYRR